MELDAEQGDFDENPSQKIFDNGFCLICNIYYVFLDYASKVLCESFKSISDCSLRREDERFRSLVWSLINDQSDFDATQLTDQLCSRSQPSAKLPQDKLFWSQSPSCLVHWPQTDLSPWNATKCAENPLTRTFSGECNFYGTLKGIQFSIRGPFSQNLNGPGNKKPLCANRSSASPTTVNIQETKL